MLRRLLLLLLVGLAVAGCAGAQGTDWSTAPRGRCAGERSDPATSAQIILFCAQSP
jgi:hypothetical protein